MNNNSRSCMPMNPKPLPLALATMLLLAGCSVTPTPLTDAERESRAGADMGRLFAEQPPLSAALTLQEAVDRGLRYNLESRVRLMEETLAGSALQLARYDMWPQLMMQAGYTERSNFNAAESVSIDSKQTSLEASYSSEKQQAVGGLRFSWNILDFGVSYAQAKQKADEALIIAEMRRKSQQNLVMDIQTAWWRVAAAQQSVSEIEELLVQAEEALRQSNQSVLDRLRPPLKALTTQKGLLELINRLAQLRKEVNLARVELAGLINLPPGTRYEVALTAEQPPVAPAMAIQDMERLALATRPELREEDYRKRISSEEARKALLRMLPGLELNFGGTHDSNKYLYNSSWADAGLQLSWNIFNVFSGPAARRYAEGQMDLAEWRRLAVSAAVLTQVHVARERYEQALSDYRTAVRLDDVERQIAAQLVAEQAANKVDASQVVMGRASALAAKLRRGLAYAELQSAVARINHSMGADPLPAQALSATPASVPLDQVASVDGSGRR
jgi:outer membrane protein, multidrug efflux system